MGFREELIAYSKGDCLIGFWQWFKWCQKAKSKPLRDICTFFLNRSARRHGGYVGEAASFAGQPLLPHGLHGVYISQHAKIGASCRIYQNVTIGEIGGKAPKIGDRCLIGAGATIIGDITIGNDVKIGAGAVVSQDIPDGCTAVAPPPRVIVWKGASI